MLSAISKNNLALRFTTTQHLESSLVIISLTMKAVLLLRECTKRKQVVGIDVARARLLPIKIYLMLL